MSVSMRTSRNILIFLIVLNSLSCNDYSSILPQSGIYKVTVYADNTPLETNSFVSSQKTFKPAFVTPVASDPDVQGLAVSIKDIQNESKTTEIVYAKTALETSGTRVLVPNLDSTLPEFTIPADLPIGPYKIVLKILGSGTVLSEKEIPFYYLADAVFNVKDIHSFPPGHKPSVSGPLFPPNINLLLEGSLVSDVRLDPYIIWYEGNRILKKGRLAEGANLLIWKTPESEGFQTIRFEVFPENPFKDKNYKNIPSVSSSLRIAVSNTAPIPGIDFASNNYSLWYHFLGTLNAERADGSSDIQLNKIGVADILWLPGEDTYGLAVGGTHQYTIETPILPATDGHITEGKMLLRFAPTIEEATGTIFYALLNNQNKPNEPILIELVMEKGMLKLRTIAGETGSETQIFNQNIPAKAFKVIELTITQSENTLNFSTQNTLQPLLTVKLPEDFFYSGFGSFGFGEPKAKHSESKASLIPTSEPIPEQRDENVPDIPPPDTTEQSILSSVPNPICAIIDEFGLKF